MAQLSPFEPKDFLHDRRFSHSLRNGSRWAILSLSPADGRKEAKMNKTLILCAAAALTLLGCASHERHYARYHYSTQPDVVVVEPGNDRTYVREYDPRYD